MQLKRPRLRGWIGSVLVVALISLANYLIVLPYFVVAPGEATGVTKYVQLPSDRSHSPSGDFLFTTVSLRQAHPFDIVWAWIAPGDDIQKKKDTLGQLTSQQFLDLNRQAMDDSKQTAMSVAMRRAGFSVKEVGDGAFVREVANGSPSSGKIFVGDVITSVNGSPVSTAADLTKIVHPLSAGASVRLEVRNDRGEMRTVELMTAARPNGERGTYVGVLVSTKNVRLDTPFPVEINTKDIGGPSAGLAFTLSLLDELTPGDLTGGRPIAVTGTIAPDGSVGPVGGVEQKTLAVDGTSARLFLVPPDEVAGARKRADKDVEVVGVTSLDDAIKALAQHGGDISGLPSTYAPPVDT